jgi:hypothetical protein
MNRVQTRKYALPVAQRTKRDLAIDLVKKAPSPQPIRYCDRRNQKP